MVTLQLKRSLKLPVDRSFLTMAGETTLKMISPDRDADVSIVVGNDALLRKLNRQYRGVDSATDVLSFPAGEIDPDTAGEYLGDVIISLPRAEDQAIAESHSLADELQLLVVHGMLHLLGYDHLKAADKRRMQAAQDEVLHALGVDLVIIL